VNRINYIRQLIQEMRADAFLLTHLPSIRYVSGFSGSSAVVLVTMNTNYFFTDFRYKEQSKAQVNGFQIIINYLSNEEIRNVISSGKLRNVLFESTHITVDGLRSLQELIPDVNFIPQKEKVELCTMIKTEEEIGMIRNAVDISDRVFAELLEIIRPGISEMDISAEISYLHKKFGAERDAFEPIVASGERGALPHGTASNRLIRKGEMVTLDFGCVYNGFCSDLTRTISVGKPSEEMKKIYSIVREAQARAVENARAGITTRALDSFARDIINEAGYGDKFGHGLGHGIGIEVHEPPGISQRTDIVLQEGTVVTIEPGIYVENLGGVRIEDDVLIKQNGAEILNKSSKDLLII
jgi:Xaa-Pro aminopeptidase